jgi:hypothetical protein
MEVYCVVEKCMQVRRCINKLSCSYSYKYMYTQVHVQLYTSTYALLTWK